ncbi:androgen-induced gene 1 protein-like isoform X2 [Patiria miniata]|uniref:Uncharacterized protein n=1 Tax=Patiria miniata TaxID=46514 RepID=A0A913ZK50_PATMI|nr:androgen-induced gene 1 protein-like isoform X2 [Patiria miniata]
MAAAGGMLVLSTILSFLGLVLYSYGLFYNTAYVNPSMDAYFKKIGVASSRGDKYGMTKFLTMWNMVFQLTYFFICCVSDLVASSGAHSPLTRKIAAFRDWFLAAVAFPIGTLVVTVFWGLWAIDRELIFPKILDEFFPAWLNHVMHTTVLPILLLDMFLVRHRYPSKLTGILGLAVVALSYLSWILWLGFVADIWVYPFLKVMEGPVFVGFILTTSVLLLGMYLVGEKVSKVFWRGHTDYDFEMAKLD